MNGVLERERSVCNVGHLSDSSVVSSSNLKTIFNFVFNVFVLIANDTKYLKITRLRKVIVTVINVKNKPLQMSDVIVKLG